MPVPSQGHYGFHSFPVVTDFVCLYTYEFWLSLCKIVRVQTQTLYRESTYKDFIQTNEMYFPYEVGKSYIVLLPIHNFSNLLSVIFIEHNFIIYIHKHRIVYKNQSVNPNIYVVVKSIVRTFINITHVRERGGTRSIITNTEFNTCNAMLGVYVVYTVILLI